MTFSIILTWALSRMLRLIPGTKQEHVQSRNPRCWRIDVLFLVAQKEQITPHISWQDWLYRNNEVDWCRKSTTRFIVPVLTASKENPQGGSLFWKHSRQTGGRGSKLIYIQFKAHFGDEETVFMQQWATEASLPCTCHNYWLRVQISPPISSGE